LPVRPKKQGAIPLLLGNAGFAAIEPAAHDADFVTTTGEALCEFMHAHRASASNEGMLGMIVDDVQDFHRAWKHLSLRGQLICVTSTIHRKKESRGVEEPDASKTELEISSG
jgi:hypothetical protein